MVKKQKVLRTKPLIGFLCGSVTNSIMTSDDASEDSEFLSALDASPESFVHKALKDEQIECIHRIVCNGRDVLAVLPTGLGKSNIYQIISKGPYSQRHIKNLLRTPCFLLAYKVKRYLHKVLLLKLSHYERNRRTGFKNKPYFCRPYCTALHANSRCSYLV